MLFVKLFLRFDPIVMNSPIIVRDREPERPSIISMFSYLASPIPGSDAMDAIYLVHQSEFGEHFHMLVIAAFVVDDAAGEGLARASLGSMLHPI